MIPAAAAAMNYGAMQILYVTNNRFLQQENKTKGSNVN